MLWNEQSGHVQVSSRECMYWGRAGFILCFGFGLAICSKTCLCLSVFRAESWSLLGYSIHYRSKMRPTICRKMGACARLDISLLHFSILSLRRIYIMRFRTHIASTCSVLRMIGAVSDLWAFRELAV